MTDSRPERICAQEILIWTWVLTLLCDEFRQIFVIKIPTHSLQSRYNCTGRNCAKMCVFTKLREHFRSGWNIYEMVTFISFTPVIFLRSLMGNEYFLWSLKIYSMTWIAFSLRVLRYFYLFRHLGPKIEMIKKMLKELLYFLLIFFGIHIIVRHFPTGTLVSKQAEAILRRSF